MNTEFKTDKTECMLMLRVPPGVPFVFFDGITGGENDTVSEMEILLPRGATVRVLNKAKVAVDPKGNACVRNEATIR